MASTEGERGVSIFEAMWRNWLAGCSSTSGSSKDHTILRRLWLLLIYVWILGVLLAFMFIRVLGSNTARHILHSRLPN